MAKGLPHNWVELALEQFELRGETVYRRSTGLPAVVVPTGNGYFRTSIATGSRGGAYVRLHRLKFALVNGYCPRFLDHQDRQPGDNDVGNLRPATRQQNMLNRRAPNRGLPRGVYKSKRGLGYFAACTFLKVRHHLGYYPTVEEASAAVEIFRRQHHGEFYADT